MNETNNKVYKESSEKLVDEKSTCSTFLLVGGIGLILDFLFAADVFPIHMATYMKVITSVFMGILFATFLMIGVLSWQKTKILKIMSSNEEEQNKKVLNWLIDNISKDDLDARFESLDMEDAYFSRYNYMKNKLLVQFPQLKEDYTDYILEKYYNMLYPDDIK